MTEARGSTFDFDFSESRGGTANGRRYAPSPATRKRAAALPGAFRKMEVCPFTILYDSSEGLPYTFDEMKWGRKPLVVPTEKFNILWGDYSIQGFDRTISIERKSLGDLYGTLTRGRNRFRNEIAALNESPYEYAAVVVEASWVEICDPTKQDPGWTNRTNPESIMGTIVKWGQKYPNVRWEAAGSRREAEVWVFQKLREFFEEKQRGT